MRICKLGNDKSDGPSSICSDDLPNDPMTMVWIQNLIPIWCSMLTHNEPLQLLQLSTRPLAKTSTGWICGCNWSWPECCGHVWMASKTPCQDTVDGRNAQKDGWKPINHGVNHQSTEDFFHPPFKSIEVSTVFNRMSLPWTLRSLCPSPWPASSIAWAAPAMARWAVLFDKSYIPSEYLRSRSPDYFTNLVTIWSPKVVEPS